MSVAPLQSNLILFEDLYNQLGFFSAKVKKVLLSLHRALLNLYIVHSPRNALFIKLGKV
jgi:hypothetical protein